jgi:hypothetical protein
VDAGEWIQLAAVSVLSVTLGAVLWYAWEARKQAKASERMADEMLETRHGTVLPVIDFVTEQGSGGEAIVEVLRIHEGIYPETFHGRLKNIGYGPALDVRFQTKLYGMDPGWQHVYRVGRDEYAVSEFVPNPNPNWPIYLEPVNGSVKRLRVEYHNVYGRAYRAYRDVSFDPATGDTQVGHLRTEPIWERRL